MNICFITTNYPGKHNKSDWVFVKQLVDAIAERGNNCYVLCPYNINHYRTYSPTKESYRVGLGNVNVYRPWHLSFSKWHLGKFSPNEWLHSIALKKAFRMMKIIPDVIYSHFWHSGYEIYPVAKKYNIPLFVATGESEILKLFRIPKDVDAFRDYVRGVICVSSKNRDESIALGLTTLDKCRVFPNAVNNDLFHKKEKKKCREQLGLPQDVFIVAFVGWFNERKGSKRVSEAISTLCDKGIYSVFIGKGVEEPECQNILFKGALPHDEVPLYLNSADIFVLPTQHEGCCNAVVEAMACGLPIISSNLSFNWDVLNSSNSIMVNPDSVEEIAQAIHQLKNDAELRQNLAEGSLENAQGLTITKRAEGIESFIQNNL